MNRSQTDSWVFFDEAPEEEEYDSFAFPSQPHQDANASRHFAAAAHQDADDQTITAILNSLNPQERGTLPANLNRMQQQLLPYCLGSDDSVVIGAPTGGGKTALLDMAILRSVLVNDSSTQMYYVAPSKALCRLQALGFAHRFRHLNLAVDVVTGDEGDTDEMDEDGTNRGTTTTNFPVQMNALKHQQKRHTLIVCTPEKLEAETRRCTDKRLAGLATHRVVLLVDEVHHLGEVGRGAVLELVLTRFLWAFRMKREALRFVCVSATIPNIDQVANWLNNALYFEFTERPVPLTVRVLGYPKNEGRNDYLFEQDLDRHVPDVLRQFGVGKPALVFVSSRKGAKDLAGKLRQAGFGNNAPTTQQIKTEDEALGEYLRWGIGFHSAGLSSQDRAMVENLFRAGKLMVVCCTSTLAVGVDLPANLCLIRSTRAYRGPLLGYQDLERATLIQMIGRAGRPGYDTEGTAVIMTSRGEESKFSDLSKGLLAVESRLVGNALLEGLNAEIVRERITSKADCAHWWKMTFAGQTSAWKQEIIESLVGLDCVREKEGDLLESTATGKVASTHHIRLETIAKFAQICQGLVITGDDGAMEKFDMQALARVVCDGAEFAELLPRRDQKKFLNSIAWGLGRFKSLKSARVCDGTDAAFQLLQAVMGGIALPDQNLRQNATLVFERAPRLCRALLKMLVDVRSNKALICCLFSKCLMQRCWEYDQVGQLSGVGVKTKEKLVAMGVQKLTEVAAGKGGLPSKSVQHAKTLLAQKRFPQVAFVDSALVVSLSSSSVATVGAKKRYMSTGWWLTCLGGPGNKLLCWSETMDRLVIPSAGLGRIMVYAIHQEALGIDSRMIAQVDHNAQQIHVISMDTDFWEGFFLAPSTAAATPAKKTRVKKEKSPVVAQIKEKMAQSFFPSPAAAAAAPKTESVSLPQSVSKPSYQQQPAVLQQLSKPQVQQRRISPPPPSPLPQEKHTLSNYAYQQPQVRRLSPTPQEYCAFEDYPQQHISPTPPSYQQQRISPPPPTYQQHAPVRRNFAVTYPQQQPPVRSYQEPQVAAPNSRPPQQQPHTTRPQQQTLRPPQTSKFEDIFFL